MNKKHTFAINVLIVFVMCCVSSGLLGGCFFNADKKPVGNVIITEGNIVEHTYYKAYSESFTHTLADVNAGDVIDRSDIDKIEIYLYPEVGWEMLITKKTTAVITLTWEDGQISYNMVTNSDSKGKYARIVIDEIPEKDFSISFDLNLYEWQDKTILNYSEPDRVYVNGGSKTDRSEVSAFYRRYVEEVYIRFEGEYNFGFGEDEILLKDFIQAYNQSNDVSYRLYSRDRVVIYCYTHNDVDNYFKWNGSVRSNSDYGNVVDEIYETDLYTGKKYTINPVRKTDIMDFVITISPIMFSATGMLK